MYILMVRLKAKADRIDDFIKASIADARGSVLNEPDCLRFDIIQDAQDPTSFAFCEVYNDEQAVEYHGQQPHFKQWDSVIHDMLDGEIGLSRCRPVYPRGDAGWAAHRPDAVDDPAFASSMFIIHSPLPVKPERVDDFIAAVTLDGLGSTHEEPGCLRFDVYQNIENPSELYLYEVYVNPAAFEYHRNTPHIKKWAETVKDWYAGERTGGRRGRNVWPPDNWNWSSKKPGV